MANDGLQYEIEFEQKQQEQQQTRTDNVVSAVVTFERGERVQARFEFKLAAA